MAEYWGKNEIGDKENWVRNGYWLNKNLSDFMEERLRENPDKMCIASRDAQFTFREIEIQANNLASNLRQAGITRGDVVSAQLLNCYQLMVINLALVKLGAVFNPIIPIYVEREVHFILKQSRSKAIFIPGTSSNNYIQTMKNIIPCLSDEIMVIVVDGPAPNGMLSFEELTRGDGNPPPKVLTDANDIKLLQYTSGTTAEPKGVKHTHNTITCEVINFAGWYGCNHNTIAFMPSPMTHIIGFLYTLEMPIIIGCSAVIMAKWNAEIAIELIERYKCTFCGAPTPFLQQMLHSPEIMKHDVSSIDFFVCGGAAVPPDLIYQAHAFGWKAGRSYGGTEFPTVSLGNPRGSIKKMAETDGKVVGYNVRIVDQNNQPVPIGESGEIVVIGPELFVGYQNTALDAESFDPDGWFHTGDIGRLDDDGYLTITGRKKDIIIRSGENISAKEIEDLLHWHPSIEEAAVVAMPDKVTGEKACAYVKLHPGMSLTFEDMIVYLSGFKLAKQKYPERLECIDEFPYTSSGKIQKYLLRKQIAEKLMLT